LGPLPVSAVYACRIYVYTVFVFQGNKKVEVCLVVVPTFAGWSLRSIENVAE
jgi:hypothetical protein